jgi:hypothetical protein
VASHSVLFDNAAFRATLSNDKSATNRFSFSFSESRLTLPRAATLAAHSFVHVVSK